MKIIVSAILSLIFVFNMFGSIPRFSALGFDKTVNREIAGTVTDKSNKFIVGLKIKAINVLTKKQYKTKTNDAGFFKFTNLPLGTYTIRFEGKQKTLPKTVENIEVGLNGGVMYNTSLESK